MSRTSSRISRTAELPGIDARCRNTAPATPAISVTPAARAISEVVVKDIASAHEHAGRVHDRKPREEPQRNGCRREVRHHGTRSGHLAGDLVNHLSDGSRPEPEAQPRQYRRLYESADPRAADRGHAADQAETEQR